MSLTLQQYDQIIKKLSTEIELKSKLSKTKSFNEETPEKEKPKDKENKEVSVMKPEETKQVATPVDHAKIKSFSELVEKEEKSEKDSPSEAKTPTNQPKKGGLFNSLAKIFLTENELKQFKS